MNAYLQLLALSCISIAISFAVLRVLSAPLANILGRVCPDEEAAAFWVSYSRLMLTITPLLLVLAADMFARFSNPLDSARLALMVALLGLLIGLYAIGAHLAQFIRLPPPGDAA
ncbi:MAG: hypothetical protein FWF20_01875 [Betaproteobacteria bacterium]|nr:hypothetical protein [Betaproteobacteria bacterium]MCL2885532.1 hypothetical protein [Betaproteobacteria bacterium]